MTKEEFFELLKQYSNETRYLSFVKTDHSAMMSMVAAGPKALPWALESLRNSIGHDSGDDMDWDNCPHASLYVIGMLSHSECYDGLPEEYVGKVAKLREFVLNWALLSNIARP